MINGARGRRAIKTLGYFFIGNYRYFIQNGFVFFFSLSLKEIMKLKQLQLEGNE